MRASPTDAVALFCIVTALLSAICHLLLEETVLPVDAFQWISVLLLGLFPVGLAFYAWDFGVKHGNIQFLGGAAYFAPLISTVILVAAGLAEPTPAILTACLLITFGAILASGKLFHGKGRA